MDAEDEVRRGPQPWTARDKESEEAGVLPAAATQNKEQEKNIGSNLAYCA